MGLHLFYSQAFLSRYHSNLHDICICLQALYIVHMMVTFVVKEMEHVLELMKSVMVDGIVVMDQMKPIVVS